MAGLPILARRQVRLAVLAALAGAQFTGVTVESPGDWSTPPEDLPAILVRSTGDRKDSIIKGQPEFTTLIGIEIEARVDGVSAEQAQDRIEALCYAIEMALLTNSALISIVNQVASVDTQVDISADGRVHFGGARMQFGFEVPEMFDPFSQFAPAQPDPVTETLPLTSIGIHLDAISPFDPTVDYPDAVFPATPAPRTAGPDGRDEGALDISLPQ